MDSSASARPSSTVASEVVQDFSVKYRRPFKGNGISDATLIPLDEYNLTSYYGCYKNSASDIEDGVDPNATLSGGVGCYGRWQSSWGDIVYSSYVDGREVSKTAIKS